MTHLKALWRAMSWFDRIVFATGMFTVCALATVFLLGFFQGIATGR